MYFWDVYHSWNKFVCSLLVINRFLRWVKCKKKTVLCIFPSIKLFCTQIKIGVLVFHCLSFYYISLKPKFNNSKDINKFYAGVVYEDLFSQVTKQYFNESFNQLHQTTIYHASLSATAYNRTLLTAYCCQPVLISTQINAWFCNLQKVWTFQYLFVDNYLKSQNGCNLDKRCNVDVITKNRIWLEAHGLTTILYNF